MSLNEIISQFLSSINPGTYAAGVIILILSIIQIAPLRLNPWSWIVNKFKNLIYGDLIKKIDNVSNQVTGLRDEIGEDRAINARVRILQFNDEMLSERMHSKESFDQALDDITYYENYCKEHPEFKNNRTKMTIENIERCYKKCLEDHDFL